MIETVTDSSYRFTEQLHHPELSVETLVEHNRLATTVTLTTSFTRHPHDGGQIGVIALLYDSSPVPQWLYTSQPVLYTLQASPAGKADLAGRRVTLPLDTDIAAVGEHLVIKHYHCPNDVWADIKDWIRKAEHPDSGYPTVRAHSQRFTS